MIRTLGNFFRFPVGLDEHYVNMLPHGQILVLRIPEGASRLQANAISDRLLKFAERPTPFVGILIAISGIDYRFSSADLGSVAATIAAWVRGWVAPCSIFITGASANQLKWMLDITKLGQLNQLRIVDSEESGLEHIRAELDKVRPGAAAR
jgi:hypothetical protein